MSGAQNLTGGKRIGWCVAGSEHSSGVIQCVLPLDLRFRLAAAVQGVSGAAGTLSAVPFPTAGETQSVHLPAESLTLPLPL